MPKNQDWRSRFVPFLNLSDFLVGCLCKLLYNRFDARLIRGIRVQPETCLKVSEGFFSPIHVCRGFPSQEVSIIVLMLREPFCKQLQHRF